MTRRKRYYWLLLLLVAAAFTFLNAKRPDDKLSLALQTIETNEGWGYNIFVDDRLFIQQVFIPVLEGRHCFKTKEEAKRVGSIAINKLKHGKMPAITREDLTQAGIDLRE